MHRNPVAIFAVLASVFFYLLIRELGHVIAYALLGIASAPVLRYGFLPGLEVLSQSSPLPAKQMALVIMSGPAATLLAGYIALYMITRIRGVTRSLLLMLAAFTSYLALIIDPIYYSIVPLTGLGGEPENLSRILGIPVYVVQIVAMVLLVVNSLLVRHRIVPLLKQEQT